MDLRQLEFVITVAEELNFTRAAARCQIAQSGLSHQVRQLERELDAKLFERTSRSVRLTHAGTAFLPRARAILREAAGARVDLAALHGQVHGTLRLGTIPFASTDVDLLALIRDYRAGYPAIDVVVTDAGSLSTVAGVLDGSVDVAFVGLFEHQVPVGVANQLLRLHPLVAVVSPAHPLAGHQVVELAGLVDGSGFLDSHPDSGLRAQVDAACARVRRRRHVVCELRNPAELAELALQGLGVAIVPLPVAEAVVDPGHAHCVMRLTDPQAVQPVAVVHRDPPPRDPAVQAFLRLVRSRTGDDTAPGRRQLPSRRRSSRDQQ